MYVQSLSPFPFHCPPFPSLPCPLPSIFCLPSSSLTSLPPYPLPGDQRLSAARRSGAAPKLELKDELFREGKTVAYKRTIVSTRGHIPYFTRRELPYFSCISAPKFRPPERNYPGDEIRISIRTCQSPLSSHHTPRPMGLV